MCGGGPNHPVQVGQQTAQQLATNLMCSHLRYQAAARAATGVVSKGALTAWGKQAMLEVSLGWSVPVPVPAAAAWASFGGGGVEGEGVFWGCSIDNYSSCSGKEGRGSSGMWHTHYKSCNGMPCRLLAWRRPTEIGRQGPLAGEMRWCDADCHCTLLLSLPTLM